MTQLQISHTIPIKPNKVLSRNLLRFDSSDIRDYIDLVERFTELWRYLADQYNGQIHAMCLGAYQFHFHCPPLIEACIKFQRTPVIPPFNPSTTQPIIQYSKLKGSLWVLNAMTGVRDFTQFLVQRESSMFPIINTIIINVNNIIVIINIVWGWSYHSPPQKSSMAPQCTEKSPDSACHDIITPLQV